MVGNNLDLKRKTQFSKAEKSEKGIRGTHAFKRFNIPNSFLIKSNYSSFNGFIKISSN